MVKQTCDFVPLFCRLRSRIHNRTVYRCMGSNFSPARSKYDTQTLLCTYPFYSIHRILHIAFSALTLKHTTYIESVAKATDICRLVIAGDHVGSPASTCFVDVRFWSLSAFDFSLCYCRVKVVHGVFITQISLTRDCFYSYKQ